MDQEIVKIKQRYKKRRGLMGFLYSPLNPSVYLSQQEKERKFIDWVRTEGIQPLKDKKMLEIGCGSGVNLLQMMKLGFLPENLVGNELLEERVENAKKFLPSSIRIYPGDATELNFQENSFDVVLQSTVFSSILDDECQQKLADKMWFFTKSGGGVLWYDFIYNNPNNSDVRGIAIRKIRELFPFGKLKIWRLTLAPPISRRVTNFNPKFYSLFNALPFLRTHVLCWIQK